MEISPAILAVLGACACSTCTGKDMSDMERQIEEKSTFVLCAKVLLDDTYF